MKIHEIGTYTSPKAGEMRIYMVEHPGGIEGDLGYRTGPAMLYNMECSSGQNLIFWPDWLAFAYAVNSRAGERVLDPLCDPAVEAGMVVAIGLECPNCGCRVIDALEWVDVEGQDEQRVFCHGCDEIYCPGKP